MLNSIQREEWKKKHSFRVFVEERLVDIGTILVFLATRACDAVDFVLLLTRKTKFFLVESFLLALVATIILFAMFW